jgi:hypothetical protein
MFFVHEVHELDPVGVEEFESALREHWVPTLAAEPGARLVWCARSMPGAISFPEIVTMTAVEDGAALERLAVRIRSGDLRAAAGELGHRRRDVATRIFAPLEEFNAYSVDLDEVPLTRSGAPGEMYIHDFVVPQPGMQRIYEVQMRDAFLKMLEVDALPMKMWGGFETVAGGGRIPLSLMITRAENARALSDLLAEGNPRVAPEPGSWMSEGLKLRDTWVSRLVRSVPWSPTS